MPWEIVLRTYNEIFVLQGVKKVSILHKIMMAGTQADDSDFGTQTRNSVSRPSRLSAL
jgi:hypothetical protein